ncbi:hypothetical protein [uncultured Thiodictyon sp.]|jgi:hypothetical protein|uniref:hypothetical protein n=1 Tax=uncultured Thiodictyon sp. TaxID=1846217 RepID=UPI0025F209EB|nr:hypothetical protein [uncultured Thiodictyon sp.]
MTQRQAFLSLAMAFLVLTGVTATTLTISPVIWQDEVQIVDFGRTALPNADLGWGISWLVPGNRPEVAFSYLGPLVQEWAFRNFDGMAGVRLAALAGAGLASFAMFGWLRARAVLPEVALFGALLFMLDPMISQSYRGARVDTLAMGMMFLGFLAVQLGRKDNDGWRIRGEQVIVGLCVGSAGLIWPSAILLLPLLIYELWTGASALTAGVVDKLKRVVPEIFYIGLFAAMTITIFLFFRFQDGMLDAIRNMFQSTATNQNYLAHVDGQARVLWHGVLGVLLSFKYDPWLPLFATLLILIDRRFGLIVGILIVLGVAVVTNPYIHRVIYVIPYLILAVVLGISGLIAVRSDRRHRSFATMIVVVMLMWSAAITIGGRTWVSIQEKDVRDPMLIQKLGQLMIGKGAYRVYIDPWIFYYAGRQLEWQMYRSFYEKPEVLTPEWKIFIKNMDFLIFSDGDVSLSLHQILTESGFASIVVNPVNLSENRLNDHRKAIVGYMQNFVIYGKKPMGKSIGAR